MLPAECHGRSVLTVAPVDHDAGGNAEFLHHLRREREVVQPERGRLRHQDAGVAPLEGLDHRAGDPRRGVVDGKRVSFAEHLCRPDDRRGLDLPLVQDPAHQREAGEGAGAGDPADGARDLPDRTLWADEDAAPAGMAEFREDEDAVFQDRERPEPAELPALAAEGAAGGVDRRNRCRHRHVHGRGREEEVEVRLLDIAVDEHDIAGAGEHVSEVCRHGALPGPPFAACNRYLHARSRFRRGRAALRSRRYTRRGRRPRCRSRGRRMP
ncbi:hypothetical protein DSECCO2_634830 [anaerobic digester metagenome]